MRRNAGFLSIADQQRQLEAGDAQSRLAASLEDLGRDLAPPQDWRTQHEHSAPAPDSVPRTFRPPAHDQSANSQLPVIRHRSRITSSLSDRESGRAQQTQSRRNTPRGSSTHGPSARRNVTDAEFGQGWPSRSAGRTDHRGRALPRIAVGLGLILLTTGGAAGLWIAGLVPAATTEALARDLSGLPGVAAVLSKLSGTPNAVSTASSDAASDNAADGASATGVAQGTLASWQPAASARVTSSAAGPGGTAASAVNPGTDKAVHYAIDIRARTRTTIFRYQPISLDRLVDAEPNANLIRLLDLPSEAVVSQGLNSKPGVWLLAKGQLRNLVVWLPRPVTAPVTIKVELLNANGGVLYHMQQDVLPAQDHSGIKQASIDQHD